MGNRGYRKYLTAAEGGAFQIDQQKVRRDGRFDGKWVLQTDADFAPEEVALRYAGYIATLLLPPRPILN